LMTGGGEGKKKKIDNTGDIGKGGKYLEKKPPKVNYPQKHDEKGIAEGRNSVRGVSQKETKGEVTEREKRVTGQILRGR